MNFNVLWWRMLEYFSHGILNITPGSKHQFELSWFDGLIFCLPFLFLWWSLWATQSTNYQQAFNPPRSLCKIQERERADGCNTASAISSVARLGGFPPNLPVLNLIVRVKIGLGVWPKFGLVWGQFGDFQASQFYRVKQECMYSIKSVFMTLLNTHAHCRASWFWCWPVYSSDRYAKVA